MHLSKTIALSAVLAGVSFAATAQNAAPTDAQSGVSHPPEAMTVEPPAPKVVIPKIEPAPAMPAPVAEKPSAAISAATPAVSSVQHSEDDSIVAVTTGRATPTLQTRPATMQDEDAMIVTSVPASANELPTGTLLRVKFHQDLSTGTTLPGTTLLGELQEDVVRNGRVMVPAGSTLTATVTSVRGGRRIHGAAMFHIEPRSFTLPDGSKLPVHAVLIDTDRYDDARVDNEGNLLRRDHAKETLAAMSLTTGGAAAAGGVLGGAPGALIGAGVGAGMSTAWWLKQDRQLHIGSGSTMIFQLTTPTSLNEMSKSGAE